jgi:hypothetical protein
MNPLENMKIRPLKKEDLEAIIEMDEKVLGENRKDYGIWINLELKI